jgi:RNA polymerase sigma-54 factor
MKHSLQLRLSQHLTLTPQLQQSIRLLQLSTLELNQEIERLLQDNPLLERIDGASDPSSPQRETPQSENAEIPVVPEDGPQEPASGSEESASFDVEDGPSYNSSGSNDNEDDDYAPLVEQPPSLSAHLTAQLSLLHLSERDKRLVCLLIDSLNDDGYLPQTLEEIGEMLPQELDVDQDDLAIALQHLQHLEPVGVGARNLAECLSLQLAAMPDDTPQRDAALEIVRHHLDVLAARKCDDDCLRIVQKLITSLNPKPGRDFSSEETRFVIADVIVRKTKGLWVATLNPDAMPRLRVNRMYADILQRNRGGSAQQLNSQLQEAKWLIKNVQQRFETILRVSQAIVDRQRNFLEHGEVAMRPLVLREIAETLTLHESTVSRVTTQKFMHTPRGIFELKYFFGSHVATEAGGAASSTAIRALIKQLVNAENTRSPLSDGQISELLGQQGIVVARRTIAKYRESMQILPVNLRKTL